MKTLSLFLLLICSFVAFAQLDDTGSTSNGSMTLGNGTGTLYQFAGDQRGTDGTNQSQGGFGILSGANQISPIVWMYSAGAKNAFQVRRKNYNGTVQNGTPLLHVDVSGKVGIGIDNPTKKLDVRGDIINGAVSSGTYGYNTIEGRGALLYLKSYGNDVNSFNQWGLYSHTTNGDLHFRSESNTTSAIDRVTFTNSGFVGIGTTNPTEELDVNGSIQSDYLKINAVTSSEGGEIMLDGPTGYNEWRIDNRYGHFRLHHSGTTLFQVNSSGTVGIGTTSTGTHKLAVEGTVGAREIKVEASGWSDFVFDDGYKLRTLEEVEHHIDENGHLPEIPSEAEVTENGINLGEMDAKLLQKIEELTLYLIEQNKQIKELKELTQQQQADIDRLKNE